MILLSALLACTPGPENADVTSVSVSPGALGACIAPEDGWPEGMPDSMSLSATVTQVDSKEPRGACQSTLPIGSTSSPIDNWIALTATDGSDWIVGLNLPGAQLDHLVGQQVDIDFDFKENGDHWVTTGALIVSLDGVWQAWVSMAFEIDDVVTPSGVNVEIGPMVEGTDATTSRFVYHNTFVSVDGERQSFGVGETLTMRDVTVTVANMLVDSEVGPSEGWTAPMASVGGWR